MQLVVFERRTESSPRLAALEAGSMGAAALGFETLEAVTHGYRRLGAILAEGEHAGAVIDLNRALAVKLAAEDAGAPEAEADSLLPPDMPSFLRRLPDSAGAARRSLAFVSDALSRYDAPDLESAGVVHTRRSVRLVAPVPRPGKLVGVVQAAAGGAELLLVASTAVAGPEDEIPLRARRQVTCTGQLAAVVGRRVRGVDPENALGCIAGFCAALALCDEASGTNPLRFSGDGFVPLGPALVTADEIANPHDLRLELRVSGRTIQSAHTKELWLPLSELVARVSRQMTLEPGDVLLSGPPQGGLREAPGPLGDGDVVEVEIERVGRLAVYARAEA